VATKAKEESDFLKLTDFSIAQAWDSWFKVRAFTGMAQTHLD
jgi:hypothetical protein